MYSGWTANKAELSLCFNSSGSADRGENALRNIVLLLCVHLNRGKSVYAVNETFVVFLFVLKVTYYTTRWYNIMPPGGIISHSRMRGGIICHSIIPPGGIIWGLAVTSRSENLPLLTS